MSDQKQLTNEYKDLDTRQTLFNTENTGKKVADGEGLTGASDTLLYLMEELESTKEALDLIIASYILVLAKLDADTGVNDTDYASTQLPLE